MFPTIMPWPTTGHHEWCCLAWYFHHANHVVLCPSLYLMLLTCVRCLSTVFFLCDNRRFVRFDWGFFVGCLNFKGWEWYGGKLSACLLWCCLLLVRNPLSLCLFLSILELGLCMSPSWLVSCISQLVVPRHPLFRCSMGVGLKWCQKDCLLP